MFKDAYDIYFLIKHYKNGVKELAQLFKECGDVKLIQEMKDKLSKKFGSPNHAGPVDVAAFMDLEDNDEIEFVKRDAYEQVKTLIENIWLIFFGRSNTWYDIFRWTPRL